MYYGWVVVGWRIFYILSYINKISYYFVLKVDILIIVGREIRNFL